MESSLNIRLLNRSSDPPPERSVTSIEIKPNSHRFTDQIPLGDESRRVGFVQPAPVLAVVAVVAHEEIVTFRYHPLTLLDSPVGEHDEVPLGPQLFGGRRDSRIVPHVLLGARIRGARLLWHGYVVDIELIRRVDPDSVAREPH